MSVAEPSFRISSYCHVGGCVGVAPLPDQVAVTSTRVTGSPVLSFAPDEWTAFLGAVRNRTPDIPADH